MPTTKTKAKSPPAKRPRAKPKGPKEPEALVRIAVVGIPASGKTTFFRFLSGHFGLNLPILYVPSRPSDGTIPLYGDLRNEVVLEETTHDTAGAVGDASVESTTRLYVSRPMEAKGKLFVDLAAGRTEQGVLTKYPLPTKFNQFVDMRLHFRYGTPEQERQSRAMELRTIDEAGGIISDYFTYDRLWLQSWEEEVTERSCRVIPHFETWPSDRRELWRRGLTMLGQFLEDADGIILLLSPALSSLRDQAQQVNLARGVFRFVAEYNLPLVIAVSKADRLGEFREEIERLVRDRSYRSALDIPDFLLRRDGSGMGTILVAHDGKQISAKDDVFLVSSAVAASDGPPLLVGEAGAASPAAENGGQGIPVMVNTTLPLARICEKVLSRRGIPKG